MFFFLPLISCILYYMFYLPGSSNSGRVGGGMATAAGDDPLATMARLRSSQSHESLLTTHNQRMMSTLDLTAGKAWRTPVHYKGHRAVTN